MSDLRLTLFDLLAFAVPGSIYLECGFFYARRHDFASFGEFIHLHDDLTTVQLILILGLGYLVGFGMFGLSRALVRSIVKIPGIRRRNLYFGEKKLFYGKNNARNWALVRNHGGRNVSAIQRWIEMKGLAQNLILGFFVLGILFLTKMGEEEGEVWLGLGVACIVLSVLFTERALWYHFRQENDRRAVETYLIDKTNESEDATEKS